MEFSELLEIVGDIPVFESALLIDGEVDAADVRRQLTRYLTGATSLAYICRPAGLSWGHSTVGVNAGERNAK